MQHMAPSQPLPLLPPPPSPSGDILKVVKDATQRVYDREKLMHMAFDEIGSLKMGQISNLRVTNQVGAAVMHSAICWQIAGACVWRHCW